MNIRLAVWQKVNKWSWLLPRAPTSVHLKRRDDSESTSLSSALKPGAAVNGWARTPKFLAFDPTRDSEGALGRLLYFLTLRASGIHPSNIDMQASSSSPRPNYRGPVKLSSHEVKWRDRQPFLETKGYMLRPRLRPGWTPSWLSTGQDYDDCEDAALLPARPLLVDATRISDGKLVYIKEVRTGDLESSIASMLSVIDDPMNHSVPILDTIEDSFNKSISYLVMPFLRLTDDPRFEVVEEVLGFTDQILEGLVFMHSHGVAHRDCSLKNVLMDATHMFPLGFHPVEEFHLDDIKTPAPRISRLEAGVKYYFVDYGISSYFPPGSRRELVVGIAGRDQDHCMQIRVFSLKKLEENSKRCLTFY